MKLETKKDMVVKEAMQYLRSNEQVANEVAKQLHGIAPNIFKVEV